MMGHGWNKPRVLRLCATLLQGWSTKNAPCNLGLYTPRCLISTIPRDGLRCWWVWCIRISGFAACMPDNTVWAWPWSLPGLPRSVSCSMCRCPLITGTNRRTLHMARLRHVGPWRDVTASRRRGRPTPPPSAITTASCRQIMRSSVAACASNRAAICRNSSRKACAWASSSSSFATSSGSGAPPLTEARATARAGRPD